MQTQATRTRRGRAERAGLVIEIPDLSLCFGFVVQIAFGVCQVFIGVPSVYRGKDNFCGVRASVQRHKLLSRTSAIVERVPAATARIADSTRFGSTP